MKRTFFLIMLMFIACLSVQAQDSLDWDIDSIFDEQESSEEEAVADANTKTNSKTNTKTDTKPTTNTKTPTETVTVKQLIQRRGFQFNANYEFNLGLAPGWYMTPWDDEWDRRDYYLDRAIKMRAKFGIDAQISESFRAKSDIYFDIPGFAFNLGDFFFDYKIYDVVFLRGGKYKLSWGISPNFEFTDLLARIPENGRSRDSFIFKADVPVGMGGLQLLALTRFDLMKSKIMPKLEDFGFGGKYNLALRHVDLDAGIFYQEGMVMRGFLSAKTTLWDTELYSEGLIAIDIHEPSNISGAGNIGFEREFFNGKFLVNSELFYNAEQDTYRYIPETDMFEAGSTPFIEGFNIALNLTYKPWEKGNPRFYLGTLYAPAQNSAQLIPGVKLRPMNNLEFYFAVPMALGDKDGYYYENTFTKAKENKKKPLPFIVIFMITLKGGVRFAHRY